MGLGLGGFGTKGLGLGLVNQTLRSRVQERTQQRDYKISRKSSRLLGIIMFYEIVKTQLVPRGVLGQTLRKTLNPVGLLLFMFLILVSKIRNNILICFPNFNGM